MATAEATMTVQVQVLSDGNVGSHLIRAPFEVWQETVKALRDSDNGTLSETVTSMLRASNSSPSPGDVIEIELQGGTETDSMLEEIQGAFPDGADIEHGDYNRKTRSARATKTTTSNGATKSSGKKKGTPRECACGCGELTGGGTFRPGHDARFKGNMLRLIREGGEAGEEALDRLRAFPNLYDIREAESQLGSAPRIKAEKDAKLAALKERKAAEAAAAKEAESNEEDTEESTD
jgi:hypothetical protein